MKYETAESWEHALELTGDVIRPGLQDGKEDRDKVYARSYKVNSAARRLELKRGTIEEAMILGHITSFVDPDGAVRIPAKAVEAAMDDNDYYEKIAGLEVVHARDIVAVTNMNIKTVRRKLQSLGVDRKRPEWADIRGKWGLPATFPEFRRLLIDAEVEREAALINEKAEERRRVEDEKKRRADLQARLVAAFPDWSLIDRQHQELIVHIGPPNSGKTHDALNALVDAGSGWYLAPLRLLAYEIFDRLNQRGVPCSLLTGEEYIPVEGAQFTAATIEMFNANQSGNCIIIDEAQMLADSDRGWAWTRAMMEAQSAEIHMIGPASAQQLITRMADAAGLHMRIEDHDRLTPIRVADRHWSMENLPPQTILVAFSRRRVLELKQELERRGRTVSVVYGSLPPEVRRRQSERFAAGETEICVATDAVGMGLNLPADNVCFYEIEKFDGRKIRKLLATEVQQIGGRAGRYGLSHAGEVGATTRYNHRYIRQMFTAPQDELTHARVAPTLEDLEMIPGSLAEKFIEWSQLRSIPKPLRRIIKIADMEERISLAQMLSNAEVDALGLAAAVRLVNAPTRESSRWYWRTCAKAIIKEADMPLPPLPPIEIMNTRDLEETEASVNYADIYLWLGHRQEFSSFAPDLEYVRDMRRAWSIQIDEALLRDIKNVKVCNQCGKVLPPKHRYGICDTCFQGRY